MIRVPRSLRMTASPAVARRRSASRAKCRAPARVLRRQHDRRRPSEHLHQLLDADVPVQRWPAGRGTHVVPDEPGRVHTPSPAATATTRSTQPASVRRSCASATRSRTPNQAGPPRRQVQVRRWQHLRLRRRNSLDGVAPARFGLNLTMGDWGVGDTGTVPDMVALLTPFSLTGAFDDFNPVGAPTGGWKGNANVLGLWAINGPLRTGRRYTNWTEASAPDGQLRTTRASTPTARSRKTPGRVRAVRHEVRTRQPCRRTW